MLAAHPRMMDPFPFPERGLDRDAEEFIVSWVANWRSIEILLYDWWPIVRHRNLLRRLSEAEVRIVPDQPN